MSGARGAHTGNLGLVEYDPRDRHAGTGVAARPPNCGLAAWSFAVERLDDTLARAHASDFVQVAPPVLLDDPRLDKARMATLLAPNGMLIELYNTRVQ